MAIVTPMLYDGMDMSRLYRCLNLKLQQTGLKRLLLCDIDGVLIDSKNSTLICYQQAIFEVGGINLPLNEIEELVWGKSFEEWIGKLGLRPQQAVECHSRKTRLYLATPPTILRGVLDRIPGLPGLLVLATSASRATARRHAKVLVQEGLRQSLGYGRPMGVLVAYGCRKHLAEWWQQAIPPVGGLMLDDSARCCQLARDHGLHAIKIKAPTTDCSVAGACES